MPVFFHDWADKESMCSDFQIDPAEINGADILLASYTYEDYSGSAYVLFERDGKLFEVEGGHCSCYGLEGQWEPSETTAEALKLRLEKGWFPDDAGPRVREVLAARAAR